MSYPKFQLTDIEREDLLAEYLPWCESITVPDIVVPEVRDLDDRMFLRLALVGRADALVTCDDDLISLAESFPIAIVTPAAITRLLDSG